MKKNLKPSMVIMLILFMLLLSGCAAIESYPVLYITVNVTNTGDQIVISDGGQIEMEMVSPLKVPRQNQAAQFPYMAIRGYSNRSMVTHLATMEYEGEGSYLFTIPLRKNHIPKYNDTILFDMRAFNETSAIGGTRLYARWRWNESESDI